MLGQDGFERLPVNLSYRKGRPGFQACNETYISTIRSRYSPLTSYLISIAAGYFFIETNLGQEFRLAWL